MTTGTPTSETKQVTHNSPSPVTAQSQTEKSRPSSDPAPESTLPPPENEYPEGGLRAWLVVLGSWFASFSALGVSNTIATLHAYVGTHQLAGYSEGSIGWIFSVYMFLVFFCGIYVGPIFDKYGPRWLILSGTIGVVTAQMLLSISTKYWHFMLVFGVLNGISASLLFTPSFAAIGHWFYHRRGLATGIASTGGCCGGIVYPIILRYLFESAGWGWGIRAIGFVVLLCCGTATLLIDTRLPPSPDASPHPDVRILRDPAFALTTLGIFLLEWSLFIPLTYISSYALAQGFGTDFAYQIPTILNAGSVVGRVLAGWWGDYAGPFNSNVAAAALSAVACLAIWLPAGPSLAGIVVFVVVFGFASGNNISISPVCIGRLCKTENYGRYYATSFTAASFSCLFAVPIAGEIIASRGGDYQVLIIFTGVVYVGAVAALLGAKVLRVGWTPLAVF
ncbi:riboflavin transporter mch5 [Colletotrichum plurivorum]|uniref:Riboflavin transporter mch5 n=1 Tax=Colletotrichum plurivorum TaxID=2175906 RepID=A0A8H6NQI4_9PEZI|nr:riboflavin transporter mch5 [Colletotrichum plurivorum]